MNPLSPLTYYRRHKRRTLLLAGLIALVTLGLYVMVGLLDVFVDNSFTYVDYLTRYSLVTPLSAKWVEPALVSQIRTHPDVAQVVPVKLVSLQGPSLFEVPLYVLGTSEADMQYLMKICDVRLKEGRLPQPRTNELVLSQEVARALGLRLGDRIGRSINKDYYPHIPTELVLVGILEGDPSASLRTSSSASGATRTAAGEHQVGRSIHTGFASYEYLDGHELYAAQPTALVVVPKEGRKAAVDSFLETNLRSKQTSVMTYGQLFTILGNVQKVLYLIIGIVDGVVAFVMASVVAIINQIALTQRLAEFGVLHAIGHSRNRLVRRVTLETVTVAVMGWVVGLVLAVLIFAWLKVSIFEAGGLEMNLANLTPLWFTLPIPLAVVALAALGVGRVFARLDAVAIVERGALSAEAKPLGAPRQSSIRPLSSWLFYQRHRSRGLMLVGIMALMILGVALPVFALSPIGHAQQPLIEYLRHVGVVSSVGNYDLDPGLVAQIRTHPAIARVIPAIPAWLALSVPPFSVTGMTIYGVREDDLPYLVNLCGATIKEGHLPRARTNEVVVSEAVAQNRGLGLGSKIGQPVHDRDELPTEMEIVGILAPGDVWLGFVSYEYQQSNALFGSPQGALLVVPVEGRKAEVDDWLEKNAVSARTEVKTYDVQSRELQQSAQGTLLLFAALEGVVALVAAIALAAVNGIFFSQRQDEFGILHAVGRSRLWLILRAAKETVSVTAVAWLIGIAVSLGAMIYAQANVYAPKGVQVNLLDPGLWLFTLPIPLAVIAASTGTIGWMLYRLDPVSIIERR